MWDTRIRDSRPWRAISSRASTQTRDTFTLRRWNSRRHSSRSCRRASRTSSWSIRAARPTNWRFVWRVRTPVARTWSSWTTATTATRPAPSTSRRTSSTSREAEARRTGSISFRSRTPTAANTAGPMRRIGMRTPSMMRSRALRPAAAGSRGSSRRPFQVLRGRSSRQWGICPRCTRAFARREGFA